MTSEVEGLDLDALEKLAEKLTDHHHLMQRDGFAALHATATQAAAALRAQAERVRVLEGRNAEVNMLAHGWMARHDWLLSFIQDQPSALQAMLRAEKPPYPSPADLPDALQAAEARAEAAERRAGELEGALRWYGEQAANCRKITSDGDTARRALDRDGGAKARALLPATQAEGE